MTRPTRIGIALSLDIGTLRDGRTTHYIDDAYVRALREAGAWPVALPGALAWEGLLDGLDGLLLPGGDDFPPSRPYPGVRFRLAPTEQRAGDAVLLEAARERGLPVLGICYGMQLMAAATGGSLHADLAHDRPGSREHRLADADRHSVAIRPGSRLASWIGERVEVNSRHHQAVSEVEAPFGVVGRSEDDVIEAIEVGEGWCAVGVQWHPEAMDPEHRSRVFSGFVRCCRGERPE